MNCPVCNFIHTRVADSRVYSDGLSIKRRRECLKCGYRFSTLEEVEILDLTVIKRDEKKESYSRDKLITGLKKALEKRPFHEEKFHRLVNNIERDIQKKKKNEMESGEIGEIVMKRLRSFDKVAYIRFASVYRAFEDVLSFQKELNQFFKKRV